MNNIDIESIVSALNSLDLAIKTAQSVHAAISKAVEPYDTTIIQLARDAKMKVIQLSKKTGKAVHHGARRSTSLEMSPVAQERGQKGGIASAGIPKTKTTRRPYGTVNFKDMTIDEKRAYWRWAAARKAERKAAKKAAKKA